MIFFFDAQGSPIKIVPSHVYQGSNKASRIWFVMPTGSGNVVNVAFKLPNGKVTTQVIMTDATNGTGLVAGDIGVYDLQDNKYYAWYYDIPQAVTAIAGKITAQFFVYTPPSTENGTTVNGEIITTAGIDITVLKGVSPQIEPDKLDSYQAVLEYVVTLNSDWVNFKTDVESTVNNFKSDVEDKLDSFNQTFISGNYGVYVEVVRLI